MQRVQLRCKLSAVALEVVGVLVEEHVDDLESFVVLFLRAEEESEQVLRVDVVRIEADRNAHLIQGFVDLQK